MKKVIFSLLILFTLSSCWPEFLSKDKDGKFLDEVVRLDEFNSEYDDYNSNISSNKGGLSHLLFSSKRGKKDFFNLVYFPVEFTYDDGLHLQIYKPKAGHQTGYFDLYGSSPSLAAKVNGDFNVLGPKTVSFHADFPYYTSEPDMLVLFYADDSEGNLDIKYVQNGNTTGIEKLDFLNSDKDDAYPSFSSYGNKIYFCSNRGGDFDIYEASIPQTETMPVTLESLVKPKTFTLRKMDELSSVYQDKCPYFYDNTMVFVSDRPGGKGGFDIYYSVLTDGKWSAPVNAGDRINTEHNEYRPLLPHMDSFTYNLMLFSSDRPGGKGGYDLYMTGLNKKY
jgi:hypothetical protein